MCELLFGSHIRPVWLVIIDYLHVFGTRIGPPEHDPPLIIDADRMLTRQIALKSFKAVAGRRVQGLKKGGGVHHNQFSASYPGEICRETLRDHATPKDRLGKFPLEAPDHERNVSHQDTYCKVFVSPRDTACVLTTDRGQCSVGRFKRLPTSWKDIFFPPRYARTCYNPPYGPSLRGKVRT